MQIYFKNSARPFIVGAALLLSWTLVNIKSAYSAENDAPKPMNIPQLKDVYKGQFAVGTILDWWALDENTPRRALALSQFDAFTPENLLKPDQIEREKGVFTFDNADKFVDLAGKNGALVVGHALVWHQQTPQWMNHNPDGTPLSREQALQNMRVHIQTVVGRYKGRIAQWDVVNEAVSDSGDELLRPSPWLQSIGEDYIAQAFRAAHSADPNALLILNDYNNDLKPKRDKTLKLLRSLLDQGVPVGAVGMQLHTWMNADLDEIEQSIEQYSALGLKVVISELDLSVLPAPNYSADISERFNLTPQSNPYADGLPDAVAAAQAKRYGELFALFARHANVIARVTLWGTNDGESWKNNFPIRGRTDYPLLFDRDLQPKPAFYAVVKAAQTP